MKNKKIKKLLSNLAIDMDVYILDHFKRHPFLWCYTCPDAMVEHHFTDDVALCYALTKKSATRKFRQLYGPQHKETINRVYFNSYAISILTDY